MLEAILGIASGAMNNPARAERHFRRAIEPAPTDEVQRYSSARSFNEAGRIAEEIAHGEAAIAGNPAYLDAHYLPMQIDAILGDGASLRVEAAETPVFFPYAGTARDALALWPGCALASNNIAAYNALSDWDDTIAASDKAVGPDPANRRAGRNLAWVKAHNAYAVQGP